MGEYRSLVKSDVSSLLRLSHELHDLPADAGLRRRHVLEGLCRIAGAPHGLFCLMADADTPRPRCLGLTHVGWTSPRAIARIASQYKTLDLPDPLLVPLAKKLALAPAGPRTFTRPQLLADRLWYASPHVTEYRRAINVDDCVYSAYPVNGNNVLGLITLHRPWGQNRPFTPREANVVQVFHSEAADLYRAEMAGPINNTPALTPRQSETLRCLLAGQSEKEAARSLGISRHTVHVHTRAIYRHFHVGSRAELLARCLGGN